MNKSPSEVISALDAKIPREAVASRSAGMGRSLSYLQSWYVIDRLNQVFGNLGWDCETVEMVLVSPPDQEKAIYRAKVRISATVKTEDHAQSGGYMRIVKEGTGWGSDKPRKDGSVESPHEMASKEAESDALKRAAMKFGMSLGLALYDKSQEFVEDAAPAPVAPKTVTVTKTTAENVPVAPAPATNRDVLNKKITAIARVCIAKGKHTKESFQAMRKEKYGVDTTEALGDTQAKELHDELEKLAEAK